MPGSILLRLRGFRRQTRLAPVPQPHAVDHAGAEEPVVRRRVGGRDRVGPDAHEPALQLGRHGAGLANVGEEEVLRRRADDQVLLAAPAGEEEGEAGVGNGLPVEVGAVAVEPPAERRVALEVGAAPARG